MISINTKDADAAERMAALQAAKADARCDACGCNWRMQRGDGFICPFCAATFTVAHFSIGGSYVQLEGQRAK